MVFVVIVTGTLLPGVDYLFQLSACVTDICGDSVVEVQTLPIVTTCVLSMEGGNTYTYLDMVCPYVICLFSTQLSFFL